MLNTIAKPFGVLLMFLYDTVQNYGVAILLFALVIKIILLPFQMKSKRGMMRQQRLQPKIAELQKKHGTNKQKINEEMAKLYKEEGVNPASGCLWGFLPLPIMLALFQVIRQPLTIMMGVAADLLEEGGEIFNRLASMNFTTSVRDYYVQISQSQFISANFERFAGISENLRKIDFSFLGVDLGLQPQWNFLWNSDLELYGTWPAGFALFLIPFLSGGIQFAATALNKKLNPVPTPEGAAGAGSMQTMMMLMPLFSVYIAFITPGALGFYWTVSTVFQIVQDIWLTKVYTKKIDAEEAVRDEARKAKEAEIEAKRLETERKKAEGLVERNPNTSKRKMQKSDKQEHLDKASEWQKKNAPDSDDEKYEPSRVGNRRYARGRAYDPDRYNKSAEDEASAVTAQDEDSSDEDSGIEFEIMDPESETHGEDESMNGEYETQDDEPADGIEDTDDDDNKESETQDTVPADDIENEDKPDPSLTTRFETKRFDEDNKSE